MAFDAYLKLDGVEGEATRKGYEKQLFLDSFSWGAHNPTSKVGTGGGAGRVEISNFTVTKKTDKSSAKLFQACCAGKHFKDAMLTVLKAGGENPVDYLKYEFKELFVTDIQWSGATGGDETPAEHVGFAFGAVTVTYTEQKADGSKGAAIVAGWDLKGAKAI
jgi:type VI secretion system secreted protein Hcp